VVFARPKRRKIRLDLQITKREKSLLKRKVKDYNFNDA
jgi:hypothetical protein